MPASNRIDFKSLENQLKSKLKLGPVKTKELLFHLNISQSTFSRLIAQTKDDLIMAGKGQHTHYALLRNIFDLGCQFTVFHINKQGKSSMAGTLHSIEPDGFYFESSIIPAAFYEDTPYFLEDLRPSGFLGRLIPQLHREMDFPPDIRLWNSSHCLLYFSQLGWNLIGNWIIGEKAFQLFLEKNRRKNEGLFMPGENQITEYQKIANDILNFGDAGSSAAGEQPKFTIINHRVNKQYIVKFSPSVKETAGQRWADLLVSEHIAHNVLSEYGKSACNSEIFIDEERVFLQIERFDRINDLGRKGIISLRALASHFSGLFSSWTQTADALFKMKIIPKDWLEEISWLETFGHLIANSDMHPGNLSFFTADFQVLGLAPVYDMLPMLYAPLQGYIIRKDFQPQTPLPSQSRIWKSAFDAAHSFWIKITESPYISVDFKITAEENKQKLDKMVFIKDLLPE